MMATVVRDAKIACPRPGMPPTRVRASSSLPSFNPDRGAQDHMLAEEGGREGGTGAVDLQSATTMRELVSKLLNCSGDCISTVLDILVVLKIVI